MNARSHNIYQRHTSRLRQVLGCAAIAAAFAVGPADGDTPPAGTYATWLQTHFPAAYGNPALEAIVWGDHADPDGDGYDNLMEFAAARDPNIPDSQLATRCRNEGDDLVITYRETTATGHGIAWLGEWSVDTAFWVQAGVRYQTIETHPGYRMREARVSRNREQQIFFRVTARR